MIIKYQALASWLQKKLHAIYILVGPDPYLLNDSILQIKKAWGARAESDNKVLQINSSSDWTLLLEEANSYSLLAEQVLIDARVDKKTIEQASESS